jgi:hypothetical protein
MKKRFSLRLLLIVVAGLYFAAPVAGQATDVRGSWEGTAKGRIFGAEGTMNITHQRGEDIAGMIEGGNAFGSAKFNIAGKVRGSYIFGSMDGHSFQGHLYPDGTIRGVFRAIDGDTYRVVLRRSSPQWPQWGQQYGQQRSQQWGQQWGAPYPGMW